jgi:hypothetical protein
MVLEVRAVYQPALGLPCGERYHVGSQFLHGVDHDCDMGVDHDCYMGVDHGFGSKGCLSTSLRAALWGKVPCWQPIFTRRRS